MNRVIKFRAWNRADKTMGHPFTLQTAIGSRSVHGVDTSSADYMQFTGLLDKNGKEIYEGDICRDSETGVNKVVEWTKNSYQLVRVTNFARKWAAFLSRIPYLEIIGNIYENPELL